MINKTELCQSYCQDVGIDQLSTNPSFDKFAMQFTMRLEGMAKEIKALVNPECPSINHNHEAIWEYATAISFITAASIPSLFYAYDIAHLAPFFVGANVGAGVLYLLAPTIERELTPRTIEFYKNNFNAITEFEVPALVSIPIAVAIKTLLEAQGGGNNEDPENQIKVLQNKLENMGISAVISTSLLGVSIMSAASGTEKEMSCTLVDATLKTISGGVAGISAYTLYAKVTPYIAQAAGATFGIQSYTLGHIGLSLLGGVSGHIISSLSWNVHEDVAYYLSVAGTFVSLASVFIMAPKLAYPVDDDAHQVAKLWSYNALPAIVGAGTNALYKYAFSSIPEKGFADNEAPKATEILNPIDQITLKDASAEPEIDIYIDTEYYEDQSSGQPSMDSSSEL